MILVRRKPSLCFNMLQTLCLILATYSKTAFCEYHRICNNMVKFHELKMRIISSIAFEKLNLKNFKTFGKNVRISRT